MASWYIDFMAEQVDGLVGLGVLDRLAVGRSEIIADLAKDLSLESFTRQIPRDFR